MLSRLRRCLASVLIVFSMSLPFAAGQNALPSVDRGVSGGGAADEEKSSSSSPVFPHFMMALYTLLIVTIVCMPSRKA